MVGLQELSCRMFVYTRGDKFEVTVILKGNEFHCFGKQTIPKDTPQEVVLAFYKEAERAATKRIEKEYEARSDV